MRLPTPTANPLLRERDGRLFLTAQALDAFADGIATVSLPWLVLDGGGSAGAAGLVFTFALLPYVLFGLAAGVVGDRAGRKRVIWTSHAFQALCAVIVPLWTLTGTPPVALALAAAFGIGTGRVFADAAAFGAVASIAGREAFTAAQATLSSAWSSGLFAGPALGGVLVAAIGPGRTLTVQAAAFAVGALLIVAVRRSFDAPAGAAPTAGVEAAREGLRLIFRDPLLRVLTFVLLAWDVVAAGALGLIVPLLREGIGLSSHDVGRVLAVGALMGIVTAPVVGVLERRVGGPRLLVWCIVANAICTVAIAAAPGFWPALIAFAAMSLVNWTIVAVVIGERQKRAPEHLQARVGISGRMVAMSAMAVGSALASALTGVISIREVYVAMGLASLPVVLVGAPLLMRASREANAR